MLVSGLPPIYDETKRIEGGSMFFALPTFLLQRVGDSVTRYSVEAYGDNRGCVAPGLSGSERKKPEFVDAAQKKFLSRSALQIRT